MKSISVFLLLGYLGLFAGEWYEGGNLHRALIRDWKKASDQNKIATCSDFVANMKENLNFKINGMTGLKANSIDLAACINTATVDRTSDSQTVATIAILCMQSMKWIK